MPSLLLALALAAVGRVQSQGIFQNLNFEAANVSGYSPQANDVPIMSGMPGWIPSFSDKFGTVQDNAIWYDAISGGGQIIAVNDINTGSGFKPLQGNFSAALFGGITSMEATISQTGLVPADAKSVRMDAAYSLLPFAVSLNGQNINMVPLGSGPNYTVYGGDITAFAGQNATLSISEPGPAVGPNASSLYLDDILFSPNAIPEPGTWMLLLCGAGVFGLRRYAGSRFKI